LIPCPILIQPFLNKEIACSYADVSKARLSNSVFTQTVCPKVRHPPKFRPQLLPCQGGVRRPDGEGTRLTVVSRRDPILTLGAGFRRRGGRAGRRDYSADFRRTQHARFPRPPALSQTYRRGTRWRSHLLLPLAIVSGSTRSNRNGIRLRRPGVKRAEESK